MPNFVIHLSLANEAALPAHESLTITKAPVLSKEAIERAALATWYWPEAEEVLGAVKSAFAVTLKNAPENAIAHAVELTKAAAELGKRVGATAYLWEQTGLVHSAEAFLDQAADATEFDLPLYLWIAFEAKELETGGISMQTRGMSDFKKTEVEIDKSERELEDVLEVLTDAALYVLTEEAPLEDGETLEVTRGKVRVRHMPSIRNDGTTALRVRFP
jgi:hypothetical protein